MDRNLTLDSHSENQAIQSFVTNVFGWMTIGLIVTAVTAWYSLDSGLSYRIGQNFPLLIGLVIAEVALVLGLVHFLNHLNAALATGGFLLYSLLTGLTLSVILLQYTSTSVTNVFITTAVMFGAMAAYGYTTKKDLTSWGKLLIMGLIGIIVASLLNIFILKSSMMHLLISYVGVVVFVGLTAYDTQKIKMMGAEMSASDPENYRKSAIMGALALYLDFINLFVMLLRIMGDRD
ncbi:Bax inhibitor-1/YccA family protein [Pseudomonas sp. F1_0610]|uniref:Bax inhibitor-1/YccA family protein n=1 Tax=Pseudomonas sp. F1_0610 TaxID=3114284 RepID=UPI0039C25411